MPCCLHGSLLPMKVKFAVRLIFPAFSSRIINIFRSTMQSSSLVISWRAKFARSWAIQEWNTIPGLRVFIFFYLLLSLLVSIFAFRFISFLHRWIQFRQLWKIPWLNRSRFHASLGAEPAQRYILQENSWRWKNNACPSRGRESFY